MRLRGESCRTRWCPALCTCLLPPGDRVHVTHRGDSMEVALSLPAHSTRSLWCWHHPRLVALAWSPAKEMIAGLLPCGAPSSPPRLRDVWERARAVRARRPPPALPLLGFAAPPSTGVGWLAFDSKEALSLVPSGSWAYLLAHLGVGQLSRARQSGPSRGSHVPPCCVIL